MGSSQSNATKQQVTSKSTPINNNDNSNSSGGSGYKVKKKANTKAEITQQLKKKEKNVTSNQYQSKPHYQQSINRQTKPRIEPKKTTTEPSQRQIEHQLNVQRNLEKIRKQKEKALEQSVYGNRNNISRAQSEPRQTDRQGSNFGSTRFSNRSLRLLDDYEKEDLPEETQQNEQENAVRVQRKMDNQKQNSNIKVVRRQLWYQKDDNVKAIKQYKLNWGSLPKVDCGFLYTFKQTYE
jgi:hypothetical protein